MKSWELLRELFAAKGIKHIAALVGRSRFLVHKWTEPAGIDASGARNPLDVLALLMAETDATRLAHWVCAKAGGRYVPAAQVPPLRPEERLPACQRLMRELGEMVSAMNKLMPAGRLTPAEQDELGRVFAQLQTDMARLLQPAAGNKPKGDGKEQIGDGSWKMGVGNKNHLPSAISELPSASSPPPGSRETGGARCLNRLPGGRCGFRAVQRN